MLGCLVCKVSGLYSSTTGNIDVNSSGQTVPPPEGGGQQAGRHPGPGAGEVQPRPKGRPGPSGSGGEKESGDRGMWAQEVDEFETIPMSVFPANKN